MPFISFSSFNNKLSSFESVGLKKEKIFFDLTSLSKYRIYNFFISCLYLTGIEYKS